MREIDAKKTILNEMHREYTLVITLETVVLLLIMLSSTANASDSVITAGLHSIEVSSSPNPSYLGQPITITATIYIAYYDGLGEMHIIPAPGGTVDFLADQNCFVHAEVHNGVATATASYSEYSEYITMQEVFPDGIYRIGVDYHWHGVIDDCNVSITDYPGTGFTHTFLKYTPTIIWDNPADIIYGTAMSSIQLNAVAIDPVSGETIDGTFIYTPAAETVLSAGTHTLHVDFIPDDDTHLINASKEVIINVLTHVQEIQQITTKVQSLNLFPEEANLLIVKLDIATQNLNKGNTLAATNNLNSLVNQVNAYINDGKIPSTEGHALIDDANDLINVINFLNPPKKSVPEFPSIALPIISVLGIIAIFGRRKV